MALVGVIVLAGVDSGTGKTAEEVPPWEETAKIVSSDGEEEQRFGNSVSISGNTALVGAYLDDNGTIEGAAYVFVRDDGVWTQQAQLLASDGEQGDRFGQSVSVFGDTALVGAHGDDDNGTISGSAYVFVRDGEVWSQEAKLLPSDGAAHDQFGHSVSLSGDTALVGARLADPVGSAYVFVRSGQIWNQQAKLLAADGESGDSFGNAVSLSGDTALVGAPFDNENGHWSGSAYVFVRSDEAWTQQAKLLPSDGVAEDVFGQSVSLSGDTALVASLFDGDNGLESGSAYVFERTSGVWAEQAKLLPSDGAAFDWFGWSVSISGDTALAGAVHDDDSGIRSGTAYVFVRRAAGWTQQAKLLASDGATGDEFGYAVSLSDNMCLVGAWLDDDFGSRSGSAYAFERDPLFDLIFMDGFESGDTSAWSSSVP